jgi:EAL domain-containing protein (putative c-di-GMP-specific phosphodiesterase class I)
VFAHASDTGRAAELERRCIETAIVGALDAGLAPGSAVFINCEATTPYLSPADSEMLAHGAERFQVVFEVTERRLLTHPPDLLRKVVALREDGFAIALDDVGTDLNSLALLDVLAPDVIKLDLALVQSQPRYLQGRTWAAVLAHHERGGAHVLAEGIETTEHLQRAFALGATLGQGFRFGRPGPLSCGAIAHARWPPIRTQQPCIDAGSPFDTVAGSSLIRRERKDTVIALSRYLEQQALEAADPPLVLTALQRAEFFTGATVTNHRRLAAHCPLVVVLARDVADDLGSGIHGVRFASSRWVPTPLPPWYRVKSRASTAFTSPVADLRCRTGQRSRSGDHRRAATPEPHADTDDARIGRAAEVSQPWRFESPLAGQSVDAHSLRTLHTMRKRTKSPWGSHWKRDSHGARRQ